MKANETRWSLLARATLFFSVFLAAFVLAAPAFSDTISLPATGQRNCYDASGDQIACTGTGQDGELQVGVVWPIPRFALNADGCSVTDSLTGLMWTRGSKLMCTSSWLTAMTYVNTLAWCGRSDWRAANINELMSLYHSGAASQYVWLANSGFYKMQPNMYFSSTSYLNGSADNPSAFSTFIQDGSEFNGPKSSTTYCVWPVRLYGTGGSARVSQTGQTLCYDAYNNVIQCTATGQDGAYGAGVAWPTSRFFDNLDGTISDQFTDLMWTTNAATAGPDPATTPDPTFCVAGVVKTWEDALTFVKTCLNSATSPYLGYRDWRLPNKNELASLLDRSQSNPSIPAGHPFLNVVTSGTYPTAAGHWTSTTSTGARTAAWIVDMTYGDIIGYVKTGTLNVWPVRGDYPLLTAVTTDPNGGPGAGTVSRSRAGATCESYCISSHCPSAEWPAGSQRHAYGLKVTLTALPDKYSVFNGWTGYQACQGKTSRWCQVTVTADTTVTANFIRQPTVSVSPASKGFGRVKAGKSAGASFWVTNITSKGKQDLTVSAVALSGDNANQFVITADNCSGKTVTATKSCTLKVAFQPTAKGVQKAVLTVSSNDPATPQKTVTIQGTGM